MLNIAVVRFPGSNSDFDALRAAEAVGAKSYFVWHRDTDLQGADVVILPGGFSYGDYLRAGAIARFSPVMQAVQRHAADGGAVLGICNGFQILCEAGLLPGGLLRNESLRFVCRQAELIVTASCAWTAALTVGSRLRLPVKHGEGRYHADRATLDWLEADGRVLLRYAPGHNPNGSARDIAGVVDARGNVAGLMPHPEHAVDPMLAAGTDGRRLFDSVLAHLAERVRA
ncbi:MAG TPA: phosphoribosylformylglycinamidine synthase subunit PurQ [Nitriliruptorales bacterium]|nr:phosphoribosylformylglycinamidine synthase subunit PurQ [Nitriliruptorales bacterium]